MGGQNAGTAVHLNPGVLDVDVEDAVLEVVEEKDGVDELRYEVAWIEIEAEAGVVPDGFQGAMSGEDIVGDLGRVDFQGEANLLFLKDLQNGEPAVGEVPVAGVDVALGGGWEEVELGPDTAAGKAVDRVDSEQPGRLSGGFHLLGGTPADPFRIPVPPDAAWGGCPCAEHRWDRRCIGPPGGC